MKLYNAVFVAAGLARRMTFEAVDLAEAVSLAAGWGAGVQGEAQDSAPIKSALPEAYDVKATCALLGGIGRTTVWKLILLGQLQRVQGIRRVLVTRRSIEQFVASQ